MLATAVQAVAAVAPPASLQQFQHELDAAWIDAALTATGTATLRRRRLPAEQVLWLVLGMALYRDRSIVEVAAALDLALPGARGPTAAASAVSQPRTRLGPDPLAWLFAHSAARWAHPSAATHRWRGLALYGVDGTTLRVADSPANRAHFGDHAAGGDARPRAGSAGPRCCAWSRSWHSAPTSWPRWSSGRIRPARRALGKSAEVFWTLACDLRRSVAKPEAGGATTVFVRTLSEAEQRALKQGVRREVGRVSERMRAVLLSARGYGVPEIAGIFECEAATVREWIAHFEAGGVPALRDRPRSGRRPRVMPAARDQLTQVVAGGPASVGHAGGVWTVLTLTLYLFLRDGITLSGAIVRRVLLTLGFRWRRPKLVLPRDPEAAPKRWQLATRLLSATLDAVVLALDECDVHLVPTLRAMWMRRGQQAEVMTPGRDRKRGISGALALDGPQPGAWHYEVTERKRAVEFIGFLAKLVAAYPTQPSTWCSTMRASTRRKLPAFGWPSTRR